MHALHAFSARRQFPAIAVAESKSQSVENAHTAIHGGTAPNAEQLAKALEEGAANTKIPAEKAKMIAENKVKGRLNNFFAEICLLNQAFVKENKVTVADHVKAVAKQLGGSIVVKAFTRFETGEGIEKAEEDYAAEVASLAGMADKK